MNWTISAIQAAAAVVRLPDDRDDDDVDSLAAADEQQHNRVVWKVGRNLKFFFLSSFLSPLNNRIINYFHSTRE